MMIEEGMPQLPQLWFWSGDWAYFLRDESVYKRGLPHKRIYMIPTEMVRARYGIKDEDLNYTISPYGALIREYPSAHMVHLSTNPEAPVILITCNFDGTESFGNSVVDANNRIKQLDELATSQKSAIQQLAEELKTARQQLTVLSMEKA
jgi:hypothetical protein